MSALYLSKVAPKESTRVLLKPEPDQSHNTGRRVNLTKMAEERKDEPPSLPLATHQPGPEDDFGAHSQQPTQSQFSKEMLYHQRQKCELRRLLKHTHPELMLDDAVDEELAEVLSSEGVTAGETGYEGEVLSRCLIFENCSNRVSPYAPKMHMAERTVGRCDFRKTPADFENPKEEPYTECVKGIIEEDKSVGFSPDPNRECEEEMTRIDVQATRKIFESQSVNTSMPNPDNKFQGKLSISGVETKAVGKQKKQFELCSKDNLHDKNKTRDTDLEEQANVIVQVVSSHDTLLEEEAASLPDSERFRESIKTSASLFQNNPFIPTNIETEHSYVHTSKTRIPARDSEPGEGYRTANVKNRAHLFESMPFNKIRHHNKDEIETMVENIKETLIFLHRVKAIHSAGSIIEVNETMIAKKAKFTLSDSGPEIKYDEVAEGGAQNFILQLLPRVNLKPEITYLKEDSKGCMEATLVNVPVHQNQFNTNKDTEIKTAHAVQLLEDILNQDNSLRKGVIIQEDSNNCAEVIVYSLYNYFNEEDVMSYSPPQGAEYNETCPERGDMSPTDDKKIRKGYTKPNTRGLLETSQDQTCSGSIRPEVTVKGNVKLFKSCIEKGDLEYLKTLQAVPTVQEQELPQNQTVARRDTELHSEQRGDQAEESTSEWVPVDMKRLKSMFSGNQSQTQPKKNNHETQTATISDTFRGQTVSLEKSQSSPECNIGVFSPVQEKNTFRECGDQAQEEVCDSKVVSQASPLQFETQDDDDRVHQAELVEAVYDNDEMSSLQTAIHSLQQATIEAKSLYYSSQEKQKFLTQESSEEPSVSFNANKEKRLRTDAELPQENEDQKLACNFISGHKSEGQHRNIETCHEGTNSDVQTPEMCSKKSQKGTEVVQKQLFQTVVASAHSSETTTAQQEDNEVVFEGKIRAALDSLERSNINVTRGDYRAAMIYRNGSRPHQERSQNVDAASGQKPIIEEKTKPESTLEPLKQEVTAAKAEPPQQSEILIEPGTCAVSEKSKRPIGQKPLIAPKPEHLKVKQRDNQATNTKNPEATQTNTVGPKETVPPVPQPLQKTSISYRDENKQDQLKSNSYSVEHQRNELLGEAVQITQETEVRHEVQGSAASLKSDSVDMNITNGKQEMNATAEEKSPQVLPVEDDMNEPDESHVDFQEARQKFGGKKAFSVKTAPVKPKRVKIAQPDNKNPKHTSGDNDVSVLAHVGPKPEQITTDPSCTTCGQTADSKDKHEKETKQQSEVEMRERRGRAETEDERWQRLSVHMDEIMRGNITAAMGIFDNLRKQEELQSILSRVEDSEQDTSEVDARSLRRVFENVPDWVVSSDKKKQKEVREENQDRRLPIVRGNSESKSSMAHVFGDLERASEEIMNLKEQTLARLVDIEEAIKKALYSVSTLKSESDIVGLSCLFKESLGAAHGSPSSGNISKISIESSRTKSHQIQESIAMQENTARQGASIEVASLKQRASPPSSPAFISIESTARKTDKSDAAPPETSNCPTCQQSPKVGEKFRTTKTLTCNSPAQNRRRDPRKGGQNKSTHSQLNPNQELSVLEVQTDREGNSIIGTKAVTENYEKTDNFGNRFYSSKTSTVITAQPETMTTSTCQTVTSPVTYQVTFPEVKLPINQMNTLMPE
ncbi:xin actin-binding repeat-containing protein 1 [Embiotoca jacksoni]|uniref:xin actin-binding repeat-containing protein 1 n=1 Tax=Embiotoca jacksoni TaxID=100190 RepID=UPI003704B55E